MIVDLIGGVRPNFVKLAAVHRAISAAGRLEARIVDTGQHYDRTLSQAFFDQLAIPAPHVSLEVGSGPHGRQTGQILERYEAHLLADKPAATVVFGDANGTLACTLAASKLGVPVAHVEAGLRSFDRRMPEELNRILTDAVANLLLVTEASGVENLRAEGVPDERIRLVGNVMIDSLYAMLPQARAAGAPAGLKVQPGRYSLVTMHRPSNVDDPIKLMALVGLLEELSATLPVVFPMHPRTRETLEQAAPDLFSDGGANGLALVAPQPYETFVGLMADAAVVLTDSGGVQEETSVLGIPCITLRENTERPVTLELGTSRLVGNDARKIRQAFAEVLARSWTKGEKIPLWDGEAGARVASELAMWLGA